MKQERRFFLTTLAPAALIAAAVAAAQQPPLGPPRPRSRSPFPDEESAPKLDPKLVLKENQKQIQDDVKQLFQLATELKQQVSKTDSAEVLSLDLVRKAEEIEKLARQIKNLARAT